MFKNIAQALTLVRAIKEDQALILHKVICQLLSQEKVFSKEDYRILRGDRGPQWQRQLLLEVARRGLQVDDAFEDKADAESWKATREAFFVNSKKRFVEEPLRIPVCAGYFEAALAAFEEALEQCGKLAEPPAEPKQERPRSDNGRGRRRPVTVPSHRHQVEGHEPEGFPVIEPNGGGDGRGYPAKAVCREKRKRARDRQEAKKGRR